MKSAFEIMNQSSLGVAKRLLINPQSWKFYDILKYSGTVLLVLINRTGERAYCLLEKYGKDINDTENN